MSKEAQQYLVNETRRVINYCIDEYDITWAEAVGCMYMLLHSLANVSMNPKSSEEDDDQQEP
jgi:hypothetical protein